MEMTVVHDTWFKLDTQQASHLEDDQKVAIAAGNKYKVHSHAPAANKHVKVALAETELGPEKRNTWYIFSPHIRIDGNEPENQPRDVRDPNTIELSSEKKGPFKLPGYDSTFYLSEPIIAGGNFSWAEATKNGTRIPVDKSVVAGILKIARTMEEVREFMGSRPITVNSWYRDPATNRRVGGASRSRHLVGDAVDFVVQGIAPKEVQKSLDDWWGSRGGIASASVFTHIDARGYKARWTYGF